MNNKKHHHPKHSNNSKNYSRLGRSLLNSMIGDYLEKENNPLAIKMGYYNQFKRLSLDEQLPDQLDFPLSNKVVVFVHGFTDLESIWHYPVPQNEQVGHYINSYFEVPKSTDTNCYGSKLHHDFGYTPFYLRYNTGLPTDKTGREFTIKLNNLVSAYPMPIDEIILIGVNMGGALLRKAQRFAIDYQMSWVSKLTKCIYLGEPREETSLEKWLHIGTEVLRSVPHHNAERWVEWLERKSMGIKLINRQGRQLTTQQQQTRELATYTETARHYFVFAEPVPRKDEAQSLSIPTPIQSQNAHFEGLSYTPLAHSDRVYGQLHSWMAQAESQPDSVPIKQFASLQNTKLLINPVQENETERTLLSGTIDFVASTYDKTIEIVETTHYALSEEPFYAMQKYPIISQLSDPIEKIHRKMLNSVYKSLRGGGKWIHHMAKTITPDNQVQRELA